MTANVRKVWQTLLLNIAMFLSSYASGCEIWAYRQCDVLFLSQGANCAGALKVFNPRIKTNDKL